MTPTVQNKKAKANPKAPSTPMFGFQEGALWDRVSLKAKSGHPTWGILLIKGKGAEKTAIEAALPRNLSPWEKPFANNKSIYLTTTASGPVVLVDLDRGEGGGGAKNSDEANKDFGYHVTSSYQKARDAMGGVYDQVEAHPVRHWQVSFIGTDAEQRLGLLVGLGLASYRYRLTNKSGKNEACFYHLHAGFDAEHVKEARIRASAINLTRHLINTPANELNPETYAESLNRFFTKTPAIKGVLKVEIWPMSRLEKEGMGLHIAVGKGSVTPPRLVHFSYRPKGAKNPPIAIVGKGITFDTGGLDLKPSSGMRLMKKDMGGSAVAVGVLYWLLQSKAALNCDVYLPLAENAVSGHSYRPGDVYTSRSGLKVEIHNTDAEGRLVLADALDVAKTRRGKDKPQMIINIATLTGAAKIALGMNMGALFSTHSSLATSLLESGQRTGDHFWPLPLYDGYDKQLDTAFADLSHCSTGRFGGTITAALFLRRFTGDVPFVHLDIGAWGEKSGAIRESGANGQAVQALIEFLDRLKG